MIKKGENKASAQVREGISEGGGSTSTQLPKASVCRHRSCGQCPSYSERAWGVYRSIGV